MLLIINGGIVKMSEQTFLTKMQEEVLDTEMEISMDTLLGDIEEWDSLSVVSFIAMILKII